MKVCVTGSCGLIGAECVRLMSSIGAEVTGIDNNTRRDLFGPAGDVSAIEAHLAGACPGFRPERIDIRDRDAIDRLFRSVRFDVVYHCAAQPSHDLAAKRPLDDFDINALGTMNLLEACRRHAPEAVFCHLSTNKVYGDGVNRLTLAESERRFDFADERYIAGIDESFPIDRCMHSPFGASKCAADLMAQEYGRYFGLRTGVFRGGCLTGPGHAGVELHGFMSHLVKTASRRGEYTIFGYRGKQVRDQIHARDVASALWEFARAPRAGEVYNLGGGRENSASLLECLAMVEEAGGGRPRTTYSDAHRRGDHVCYYTDLSKFRRDFPAWELRTSLGEIVREMVECERSRAAAVA